MLITLSHSLINLNFMRTPIESTRVACDFRCNSEENLLLIMSNVYFFLLVDDCVIVSHGFYFPFSIF